MSKHIKRELPVGILYVIFYTSIFQVAVVRSLYMYNT